MRTCTVVAAMAAGTLLLSCTAGDEPLAPSSAPNERSAMEPLVQEDPDDPLAALRKVPGFGGFFLDSEGRPTLYLTNTAQRGQAERALASFLSRERLPVSTVRVLPAQYAWNQLESWFTQASTVVLGSPGSIFVDADEATNRVVVGVERGAKARIRGVLARHTIPGEAVVLQEADPFQFAATLRNRIRPVVGGLQINFPGFLCTLGFNAVRAGQRSFITNSHCTSIQGGTEGTPYWQPSQTTISAIIGTEVSDPLYFRNMNGCPAGRRCRFSDASRAAYASSVGSTLGRIARTTGPNNGSLTIDGRFNIIAEGRALVGQTVNKVGRTTGWTRGRVTHTCVNVNVTGTNTTQLCQSIASARVAGGDSGSPVFTGSTGVTLTGILWGGNENGTQFVYSPIQNIERELGSLTTF